MKDGDGNLLRVITDPLLDRLASKSEERIFHVLLDAHPHRIFDVKKPVFNVLAHLDLSVEKEQLAIA